MKLRWTPREGWAGPKPQVRINTSPRILSSACRLPKCSVSHEVIKARWIGSSDSMASVLPCSDRGTGEPVKHGAVGENGARARGGRWVTQIFDGIRPWGPVKSITVDSH